MICNFFRRFRLKKGTVERLLQQIEHNLLHRTNRNHCVTLMVQLLLTLRYFASGSLYIVAADFAGVSKATAGKIIAKVTNVIASLRPQYIALANSEAEQNIVIDNFYRIARFPRTIGAIDCTHIRIQSPVGDNGYAVRKYLITPLANPQSPAENLFNESQIRTRNVIERTFGVWKRRFPILSVGMRCRISLMQVVIVATAILLNLARMENEELPPDAYIQ
ncbi:DDE superfamily endonuclease [Popillia japonica]|uniref:DDE superfamily endonuclease n=1 Tax=Popillia japonica TaxID=7064 RepID=A0AAW1L8E0_POPJA